MTPNSIIMPRTRKIWTEDECKVMREMFPCNYTAVVCEALNRSYSSITQQARVMGLKKSDEFRETELSRQAKRLNEKGLAHRFKKGTPAHNKGKKIIEYMPAESIKRCAETQFKKGMQPHNVMSDWQESIKTDSKGRQYKTIKLPGAKTLTFKHVWVWEQANGKVPKGFNIVFKDKNTMNCEIENLECISNAELMLRNTIQRYPRELKHVIRLTAKLNKIINHAEKQN